MGTWSFWRGVLLQTGFFLGMFVLMSGVVWAAGGTELIEFTGGAERIFSATRAVNFVRFIGVALFALTLILGFNGNVSVGWAGVLSMLLLLGGWFGAEPVVDAIFVAGVVI